MEWFLWRPVYEGKVKWHELQEYTLSEIVHLHNIMDIEADIQHFQDKEMKASMKRR